MLNKVIDISPPNANLVDLQESIDEASIDEFLSGQFVKIGFRMEIGDIVDSEIMQLYPVDLARDRCESVAKNMQEDSASTATSHDEAAPQEAPAPQPQAAPQQAAPQMASPQMAMPQMGGTYMDPQMGMPQAGQQVNVQPAQFTAFSGAMPAGYGPENIDLIMDVPLDVTVELGRTSKSIKEILDFAPGTIIELNRIAGEPIDVLVNGKFVAKGEVVIIEESYGLRITEIVK
jgi:flagellar motor switch protein FliN/FliY